MHTWQCFGSSALCVECSSTHGFLKNDSALGDDRMKNLIEKVFHTHQWSNWYVYQDIDMPTLLGPYLDLGMKRSRYCTLCKKLQIEKAVTITGESKQS